MTIPAVRNEARRLLKHSAPGKKSAVARHIARAERIAEAIYRQRQVPPSRWQRKFILSYLDTLEATDKTKYDYYLTIRRLLAAMGKESILDGYKAKWMRPNGEVGTKTKLGRPIKLPNKAGNKIIT